MKYNKLCECCKTNYFEVSKNSSFRRYCKNCSKFIRQNSFIHRRRKRDKLLNCQGETINNEKRK